MLKGRKAVLGFGFWVLSFGFWVLCSWCPAFGAESPANEAQQPLSFQMKAAFVPNQARVGDTVTLKLTFQLPKGEHLTKDFSFDGLEGFQILSQSKNTDGKAPGEEYALRLMVERLKSKDVGPITLSYKNAEGKTAVLKAAPVPFTVLSNLGDKPEEAQLKPIFGITPTSSFFDKYRLWILCGIGVLVLALAVGWWIQKRRGKTAAPVWKAPPHETAMRELKALDGKKLFEQGRVKDFYFDFSEILRRYVEAIRGFPAAEYTIEEISRAIIHNEDQAALKLLRQADMVKFADSLATPAGKTDHMESAFAYIRKTAEILGEEQKP
jgi:hypothetical protein